MMGRGRFRQSDFIWGLAVITCFSCGSASKKTTPQKTGSENSSTLFTTQGIASSAIQAELRPAEVVDGSILLMNVQLPAALKAIPILKARFGDEEVLLYSMPGKGAGVYQAPLGIPHSYPAGKSQAILIIGEGEAAKQIELSFNVINAGYKTESLKVASRHVNPRRKDMIRIEKEIAEIKSVYDQVTLTKYWKGPFRLPIQSAIRSPFGTKRLYNGEMRSFHQGLDLAAKTGTPIHAAAPGQVAMAQNLFFTGNTVLLDHGYGVFTIYAHMSRLKVRKGDIVEDNQILGLAGMTGRATGPHLHWGAVVQKAKVNPLDLTRVLE